MAWRIEWQLSLSTQLVPSSSWSIRINKSFIFLSYYSSIIYSDIRIFDFLPYCKKCKYFAIHACWWSLGINQCQLFTRRSAGTSTKPWCPWLRRSTQPTKMGKSSHILHSKIPPRWAPHIRTISSSDTLRQFISTIVHFLLDVPLRQHDSFRSQVSHCRVGWVDNFPIVGHIVGWEEVRECGPIIFHRAWKESVDFQHSGPEYHK